jgi:hypothetical protein
MIVFLNSVGFRQERVGRRSWSLHHSSCNERIHPRTAMQSFWSSFDREGLSSSGLFKGQSDRIAFMRDGITHRLLHPDLWSAEVKQILWWLIAGSKGGINRARIIMALDKRPYNANQITQMFNLDYKTVRHHLDVLKKHHVVTSPGGEYGTMFSD